MSDPSKLDSLTQKNSHQADEMDEYRSRILKLGEKLMEVNSKEVADEEERQDRINRSRGVALGIKLSSEMVAAIIVGTIMGYGFDYLFNSKPWFFIAFMLLGFITGILNVIRGFEDIQTQINVHKKLDKKPPSHKQTMINL